MLVKEALSWAAKELKNFLSRQLEARILLSYSLGLSQENLLVRYNDHISESERLVFLQYVERRKLFEPIAYITGKKEFYGMDFFVDKNVLIPRPETELLVDEVVQEYKKEYQKKNLKKDVTILELGTGSGAISVSLASIMSLSKVTATDISSKALEIARNNAKLNHVVNQIDFIESDWYENLGRVRGDSELDENKFDFIVSNPPYIDFSDKLYISQETLLHEPKEALFAKNNGLANYYDIISGAKYFLKNNGKIFLEIGFNQSQSVIGILKEHYFNNITLLKDLSGHERIIKGTMS